MGYAGYTSLQHVGETSARSVLGIFVLLGVCALIAWGQFITKECREELEKWGFEKRAYRDLLRQYRQRLGAASPPKRPLR